MGIRAMVLEQTSRSVILNMAHPNKDVCRPEVVVDEKDTGTVYAIPGGKTFSIRGDAVRAAVPVFEKAGFVCQ